MRIFGKFEIGYEGLDLYRISLTPFSEDCYYLDLDGEDTCETYIGSIEDSSWKPYNVEIIEDCEYSPTLDTYMSEDEANEGLMDDNELDDDFVDAEKITVYKEGKLIKEYFTHD